MRTSITAQQAAFFTQNGYIELEGIPFDPDLLFQEARLALTSVPLGRDLWRKSAGLKKILQRTLGPLIFSLLRRPARLGCDQWMSLMPLDKACPSKDLFSLQGLLLTAIFIGSSVPKPTIKPSAIGITPFPSQPQSILLARPEIVIDWRMLKATPADLYLVTYAHQESGVYVYNPLDPATHFLKELGYQFGDRLTESKHPLIIQ